MSTCYNMFSRSNNLSSNCKLLNKNSYNQLLYNQIHKYKECGLNNNRLSESILKEKKKN